MTQIEKPKIVKKKLFSPIWLLPIVALALGAWLGLKSIKESGIEVRIHFPSASGMDVGKTLVRYQGLTVGKVVDISIDEELQGVNVDVLMDYRAEPFLRDETKFWLVTPKASITGVEGLDALFSGNYIGIQPGDGDSRYSYEAERSAPAVLPSNDGLVVELSADRLGSLDVGSPVFYRQVPVGSVVSYRLDNSDKLLLSAFIQEQYAYLVKKDSRFWNVSGIEINASLSGVKVSAESLAAILAGGINFDSPESSKNAVNGDSFTLYDNETEASGGASFILSAKNADGLNKGSPILYRGLPIGEIEEIVLADDGVALHARLDAPYSSLLTGTAQFWREGAELSLSGIKHPGRLLSGDAIAFLPGTGEAQTRYALAEQAPDLSKAKALKITLRADENPGISPDAELRYKKIAIGKVTSVALSQDFNSVEYQAEVLPEFAPLLTQGSDFIAEAALDFNASLDGVSLKSGDFTTLTKGSVSLRRGQSRKGADLSKPLPLFASSAEAGHYYQGMEQLNWQLYSDDGADLSPGAPVYYKKMQIGQVKQVSWQSQDDRFAIALAIDHTFAPLLKPNAVFWRNQAVSIDAGLSGVKLDVAPLAGAIKGSISLGFLEQGEPNNKQLYASESLARNQAVAIGLSFPASATIKPGAAIRYQGHQIGEVTRVTLSDDLNSQQLSAFLYGRYAEPFLKSDSRFSLVNAEISLKGIKAPETLLTGAYISALPGQAAEVSQQFNGQVHTAVAPEADALQLVLSKASLGSVNIGTGIFFRGIQIGDVTSYRLAPKGDEVWIQTQIAAPYRHLINQSSRFYDLSGIRVDLGLFSGAQIETGSLETILAGGIGVVTELDNQSSKPLENQSLMPLHDKPERDWLNWRPRLSQP
ncbi:PqiB family protein [Shewanella algae]|uniref:PqiB family protein n=1 Tax=Shewanella algae TaxID=38313 RepID=UPI0012DEC2BF|nr:MlaD family protein [Shewanella algae]MBO2565513.1 MCE family protein [Shewanella algae]QGS59808.1 MCE family protein [Shewanella algae]QTE93236.1 MCE family protein [Shewanella algae]